MFRYLDQARIPEGQISRKTQIINTVLLTIAGLILGIISKWLDEVQLSETVFIQRLLIYTKMGELLSWFSIWFLFCMIIAIKSHTPSRACLNVMLFLLGMCATYHWMGNYVYHMNINNYMMIWYGASFASPVLSIICWYSKGETATSMALQIIILLGMMFSCSIFDRNVMNVLIFVITAVILKTPKKYKTPMLLCKIFLTLFVIGAQWPIVLLNG